MTELNEAAKPAMRICSHCGIPKEEWEYWQPKDGWINRICRVCRREQNRIWLQTPNGRVYKAAERKRARQTPNGRIYKAARYKRARQTPNGKAAAKRQGQTPNGKARYKRYRQTPNGRASHKCMKIRRRSALAVAVCDLTADQWPAILISHNYLCLYCGCQLIDMPGLSVQQVDALGLPARKATQDHVHPISKGGNHTADNVVPACISCNSSKCDKIFKSLREGPSILPQSP